MSATLNSFDAQLLGNDTLHKFAPIRRSRPTGGLVTLSIVWLGAVLAPPGKQIGREIRRGLALARGAGRQRLRIEFRLDRLTV